MSSLRAIRRSCGLSQAALAERAGVTRPLVAAAEAGRHVPSVDAAIRIARVLGVSVEELFSEPSTAWVSALGETVEDGELFVAAHVGDRLVVAPLRAELARGGSWAVADGIVESGAPRLFAGTEPQGLVVLGCDPALGMAAGLLPGVGARRVLAVPATTVTALAALQQGRCHAAVVHGPADGLPQVPSVVRRFHLARWRVGLAAPRAFTLPEVLLAGEGRLVQRDRSAASQQALERAANTLGCQVPSGPAVAGHIDAARVARERDGVAVTYEPAATRFGLEFLSLETHVVEVWAAERFLDHPGMAALGELLAGRGLRERLSAIGGYDLEGIGTERRAA